MNIEKLWLCLECDDVDGNSEICPVCASTHRVLLRNTPVGNLGSARVQNVVRNIPRPLGHEVFIPGHRFGNRSYPARTFSEAILPAVIKEAVQIEKRAAGHWVQP